MNVNFPAGRAGKPQTRHQPTLVIMAKVPEIGRVKTRLANGIGGVAATYFFRSAALAVMTRLANDTRWRTVIAVAPDVGRKTPFWPSHIARIPQGIGDLGARMQRVFDGGVDGVQPDAGPLIIIGTDIPAINPSHIAKAFDVLGRNDAVLGPADDGGYWLIGLRRQPRVLRPFAKVRWSAPETMENTLSGLEAYGARVGIVDVLDDVDDAGDYQGVRAWAGRVVLPFRIVNACPH